MALTDYEDALAYAHWRLAPRTYLEIGVFRGRTFRLAGPDTVAVGVDPEPMIEGPVPPNGRLFPTTSDEFFEDVASPWIFNRLPLDFVFIDGMHLFEYALRDFLNVERLAHPGSVVVLHDCLPTSEEMTGRDYLPTLDRWTGDVWKVPYFLSKERPDLQMTVIDAPPTGLTVVRSVDPDRVTTDEQIGAIIERYRDSTYDDFLAFRGSLPVVPLTRAALDGIFPQTPFGSLTPAVRTRRAVRGVRGAVLSSPVGPLLRSARGRIRSARPSAA